MDSAEPLDAQRLSRDSGGAAFFAPCQGVSERTPPPSRSGRVRRDHLPRVRCGIGRWMEQSNVPPHAVRLRHNRVIPGRHGFAKVSVVQVARMNGDSSLW